MDWQPRDDGVDIVCQPFLRFFQDFVILLMLDEGELLVATLVRAGADVLEHLNMYSLLSFHCPPQRAHTLLQAGRAIEGDLSLIRALIAQAGKQGGLLLKLESVDLLLLLAGAQLGIGKRLREEGGCVEVEYNETNRHRADY